MSPRKRASDSTSAGTPAGRYAYEGLDRVLHEKARLGIMTSLLTQSKGLMFSDLKELCSLSDGNLNRHLAVLQETGFVAVEKTGSGRGSKTRCSVTRQGKKMFLAYLAQLEQVIADAQAAQRPSETNVRASRGLQG